MLSKIYYGALKTIFRSQVKKKDQINIESKLKTVRFIGELVKFKMFPKSECLHCMKVSISGGYSHFFFSRRAGEATE